MERTLKDIIEPTIRKKFRALHTWSRTTGREKPPYYNLLFSFRDDDDNELMEYNVTDNELWIDLNYFMLHYFGGRNNRLLFRGIFADLLNDYFEKTNEDIVVNKDVTIYFYP